MTNCKEIVRLHSMGINNTRIAESCCCACSTVIAALQCAAEQNLSWNKIKNCSAEEVAWKLYPSAALSQQYKMPDYEWLHREMQKNGVTRILSPDNLKTGVLKNSRSETVLNKSYQETEEHYGMAILPARPRSPEAKAFVEGSVGVASTWILAALHNCQFLSLAELNQAIREKLELFSHKPFQKREGSRVSCFADEKLFLLPLPAVPFELATWKVSTVQYNYHIIVERMNYSVLYEYIKQQVDVRLTRATVEIFFAGTRIASHLRLHGRPNQYNTVEEHMPPDHKAYLQWNGERFLRWAEQVGQHTAAVVRLFSPPTRWNSRAISPTWRC